MRIGLIDVDSHSKKKQGASVYPNLALCKVASYYKQRGDIVEWVDPLFGVYDIVYMSKIFNFTQDYNVCINSNEVIKGGTGYDIASKLPEEIDEMQPDYSIYPSIDGKTSFGFLTRGCPNKCGWCVVPRKEGAIHKYWDVDRVANGRKKLVLMDNNILAAGDYASEQLDKIIYRGYRVDFNQALDARLVTDNFAKQLAKIKWKDNLIRFGCDSPKQIEDCERAMELINRYGYQGHYFLFTMLNNDFEESYNRVNYWREKMIKERSKGGSHHDTFPFSQPYRDPDNVTHPPQWQRDMARWVLRREIFLQTEFGNYEPRKGFKCSTYFE